ncbi:SlyX family protein [Pseudomonas sp. LS44]|uniref:SlyX family protein n=1 Tax=Pseudomonas sp. LS44 TaxID=1357074 RepID=UPI00215A22E8|nr:SlyX family protein [Pseudomonas sp. LS44]UVE16600.1 SlyX family protein [Pseudomonas sp. LS44]
MNTDERINELESRLAFQDDTIQTLNDVLVTQQQTLERLRQQVAALAKRQDDLQGRFDLADDDVPPPHY